MKTTDLSYNHNGKTLALVNTKELKSYNLIRVDKRQFMIHGQRHLFVYVDASERQKLRSGRHGKGVASGVFAGNIQVLAYPSSQSVALDEPGYENTEEHAEPYNSWKPRLTKFDTFELEFTRLESTANDLYFPLRHLFKELDKDRTRNPRFIEQTDNILIELRNMEATAERVNRALNLWTDNYLRALANNHIPPLRGGRAEDRTDAIKDKLLYVVRFKEFVQDMQTRHKYFKVRLEQHSNNT